MIDSVRQITEQNSMNSYVSDAIACTRYQRRNRLRTRRHGGFTLIEIMVALAVFSLMLTVILIPINLSLDLLHIGKARSEVQQASQVTLDQLQRELRQAVYVFPNAQLRGVTDRYPYGSSTNNQAPYIHMDGVAVVNKAFVDSATTGACTSSFGRRNNTARIDFLVPRTNPTNGIVLTPTVPEYYLVTYYARRLVVPDSGDQPYDPFNNPVVLFRAQTPYRIDANTFFPAPDRPAAFNLNTTASRYPLPCAAGTEQDLNRGSMWLTQSQHSEPNLEPLTRAESGTVVGSHTLVTPRGMALIVPEAGTGVYSPTTSFVCEDTDGDGKINRVTISLELAQFDSIGADTRNGSPVDQRIRFPRTVDLPNVK